MREKLVIPDVQDTMPPGAEPYGQPLGNIEPCPKNKDIKSLMISKNPFPKFLMNSNDPFGSLEFLLNSNDPVGTFLKLIMVNSNDPFGTSFWNIPEILLFDCDIVRIIPLRLLDLSTALP